MAGLPPNPPTSDLVQVPVESLTQGDEVYVWYKYLARKWIFPLTFIEIDRLASTIRFTDRSGNNHSFIMDFLGTGALRIFKKDVLKIALENKAIRQQAEVLRESIIGNGPILNHIGEFMGANPNPIIRQAMNYGRNPRHRRASRKNRKNRKASRKNRK